MSLFGQGDLINTAYKPKSKCALSNLLPEIVHVVPTDSKYILDSVLDFCMKYHGPLVTYLCRYVKLL